MPYNEALAQRLRTALAHVPDVSERKMFGGIAFMAGDNMCIGVIKDDLMARVGPEGRDAALARPGARPMDFTGRPMKGFVYVSAEAVAAEADLRAWVDTCLAFVDSLPPKLPARARPPRLPRK